MFFQIYFGELNSQIAYLKNFPDPIFNKKIYRLCINRDFLVKNSKTAQVDPGWESKPGNIFRYYSAQTTRTCFDTVNAF